MRNIIIKISTLVFMFGLIFTGFGIWKIFKERNVGNVPKDISISAVVSPGADLIYATINGGKLDITNTYEHSLTTKKSDLKLHSNYYIPVLSEKSNNISYILKVGLAPNINDLLKPVKYSGLLQSKNRLPKKILDTYSTKFPGVEFSFLDSSYKPETNMQKFFRLKLFLYLLFFGLIVRIIAIKKEPSKESMEPAEH